jgi:hypothetical protein
MNSNAETALAVTGTTQPARGRRWLAGLPCLYCNDTETVRADLADLTGDTAFYCSACDAEFSLADVHAKIAAWLPVIRWVEAVPRLPAA